jgi:hypothetical protein
MTRPTGSDPFAESNRRLRRSERRLQIFTLVIIVLVFVGSVACIVWETWPEQVIPRHWTDVRIN